MDNETGSVNPFLPVELLLKKSINRYFSSKNRDRDLIGYGLLYIAFKKFHTTVNNYFKEFEDGLISNGILDQPRKTLYLKDSEMKIEVIQAEDSNDVDMVDVDTSSTCVFSIDRMTKEDFAFINGYKK